MWFLNVILSAAYWQKFTESPPKAAKIYDVSVRADPRCIIRLLPDNVLIRCFGLDRPQISQNCVLALLHFLEF